MKVISPVHWEYRITQGFGARPEFYAQFWQLGHAGIDIAWKIPWDKPTLYSPVKWVVSKVKDHGDRWYGKHIKILADEGWDTLEHILAHLDEIYVVTWQEVDLMTQVWVMGNTWNSYGVHLHLWKRTIRNGKVVNYNNGYYWYYDFPITTFSESEYNRVDKRVTMYADHFGIDGRSKVDTYSQYEILAILSKQYYEIPKT